MTASKISSFAHAAVLVEDVLLREGNLTDKPAARTLAAARALMDDPQLSSFAPRFKRAVAKAKPKRVRLRKRAVVARPAGYYQIPLSLPQSPDAWVDVLVKKGESRRVRFGDAVEGDALAGFDRFYRFERKNIQANFSVLRLRFKDGRELELNADSVVPVKEIASDSTAPHLAIDFGFDDGHMPISFRVPGMPNRHYRRHLAMLTVLWDDRNRLRAIGQRRPDPVLDDNALYKHYYNLQQLIEFGGRIHDSGFRPRLDLELRGHHLIKASDLRVGMELKGELVRDSDASFVIWPHCGKVGTINHDGGSEFVGAQAQSAARRRDIAVDDRSPRTIPKQDSAVC